MDIVGDIYSTWFYSLVVIGTLLFMHCLVACCFKCTANTTRCVRCGCCCTLLLAFVVLRGGTMMIMMLLLLLIFALLVWVDGRGVPSW